MLNVPCSGLKMSFLRNLLKILLGILIGPTDSLESNTTFFTSAFPGNLKRRKH